VLSKYNRESTLSRFNLLKIAKYLIEILYCIKDYMRWNIEKWVEKGIRIFDIDGHGSNGTVHLIPEGKDRKDMISIHKKAMKVIKYSG